MDSRTFSGLERSNYRGLQGAKILGSPRRDVNFTPEIFITPCRRPLFPTSGFSAVAREPGRSLTQQLRARSPYSGPKLHNSLCSQALLAMTKSRLCRFGTQQNRGLTGSIPLRPACASHWAEMPCVPRLRECHPPLRNRRQRTSPRPTNPRTSERPTPPAPRLGSRLRSPGASAAVCQGWSAECARRGGLLALVRTVELAR